MSLVRTPWSRFALAAATGAAWALSFPTAGVAGLAWAVPGLLLFSTIGADSGLVFRTAYFAGLIHYLISLSWLRFIPFPAGAYAGWFTLSLVLALGPACWALATWRMARLLDLAPAGAFTWMALADGLRRRPWASLNAWFALSAAAWVAWEMLLARLSCGFPWNLLGASQYRMLPVIQVSAFTGVYGVSFLMVWFSVSLFAAVLLLVRDPDQPAAWRRPLVFPALMVVVVSGGGFLALLGEPGPSRRLNVALVQPNIPQTLIFDPGMATNRFETLLRLTERALATRPDLVLWPEASLPGGLSRDNFDRLLGTVRAAGVWMVFGADEIAEEPGPAAGGEEGFRAYNSAFLVNPQGEVVASYRKRRLVMFGEYIPFGRWLPVLQRLAPIGDGFYPGDKVVPFHLGSLDATTSALICFEDNFPQDARAHATEAIDFLLNLTNNAWFGESAAQWQHAANAAFRAIENGLPLVRCCNNGLSCWIDERGRFHSTRLTEGGSIYEEGFEVVQVSFGPRKSTFYNRIGDLFGWLAVSATLLALGWRFPRHLRAASRRVGIPR